MTCPDGQDCFLDCTSGSAVGKYYQAATRQQEQRDATGRDTPLKPPHTKPSSRT